MKYAIPQIVACEQLVPGIRSGLAFRQVKLSKRARQSNPFAADLFYLSLKEFVKVFRRFKGQIVVDLGTGVIPYGYIFAYLARARGYIAVERYWAARVRRALIDPTSANWDNAGIFIYEPIKRRGYLAPPAAVAAEDALSFLKRLPDHSVSVFASGFDKILLPHAYRQKLAMEIARVVSTTGAFVSYFSDISPHLPKQAIISKNLDPARELAMYMQSSAP